MVDTSGTVINLKVPFYATSFLAANISQRVVELQKQCDCGKTGFQYEFEVRSYASLYYDVANSCLQQLKKQKCNLFNSRKEGARPENKAKNRSENILPCKRNNDIVTLKYYASLTSFFSCS